MDDESEESDPLFEITVRSYHEPEVPGKTVAWGIPASNEKVAARVKVGVPSDMITTQSSSAKKWI